MKLEDLDISKESPVVRDLVENVKNILNFGNVEIDVTEAGSPSFNAPQETKFVLSLFGAQYRLYISYLGDWYYTTLTKL